MEHAQEAVRARGQRKIPLGINLGKSKDTSLDKATEDYLGSFRLLADHADYMVVNVSSPNTPGLRELQDAAWLKPLLSALVDENRVRATVGKVRRPLLLKIAPDLSFPQIDAALGVIADLELDGIIATNTTLARPGSLAAVNEAGGLSGAPLRRMRATGRSSTIFPGPRAAGCRSSAWAASWTRRRPARKSMPARRSCSSTPG